MPVSQIVQFFYLSTFAACVFAFWKGGAAERFGSVVILAATITPVLVQAVAPADLIPLFNLTIDGLVGVALLVLTVRFGSVWLGITMLLYAAQFALQSVYIVTERPHDLLFFQVNNVVFFMVSITLWAGALLAWRRQRRPAPTNS